MAKVSIVMPVFNKEAYLEKTLSAIRNQVFQDWELIIVNDGSTDGSRDILERFVAADHRMILIYQENAGVSSARNAGIHKATGEWVWFVDADDVPDIDFLNHAFAHMIGNPSIIVGNYSCLFPDGRIEQVRISESGLVDGNELVDLFMLYQYQNGYWGYLWNKLIRRQLIMDSAVLFKDGLTLAEDLNFMVSLYQAAASILLLPDHAMQYTVDAGNSSKDKKIDYEAQLQIQLEIFSWIIEKKNRTEYMADMSCLISRYAAYIVFYAFEDGKDYKTFAMDLIKNPKTYALLNPARVEKTMAPIVKGLKAKKISLISMYLNGRSTVRTLYRIVRKK